jgi:hypothetical protein
MDPNQLYALLAQMQSKQGGMFGGQPQIPAGATPPLPGADESPHGHHGGLNPLMMLSPMGGMLMSHPKYAMFGLSPALGLANILGAFK